MSWEGKLREPHKTQAQAQAPQTGPRATTGAWRRRGHARYMNSPHSTGSTTAFRCYAVATCCSDDVASQNAGHDTVSPLAHSLARNRSTILSLLQPVVDGLEISLGQPPPIPVRGLAEAILVRHRASWGSIHSSEDRHHPKTPAKRPCGYQLEHQAERFLPSPNLRGRLQPDFPFLVMLSHSTVPPVAIPSEHPRLQHQRQDG